VATGGTADRRVVVVTGGGGGIGAAVAEALGRRGDHVVTLDPLVSLDGAEQLAPAPETTAARIVAAGGSAQASSASVTDGPAVQALFRQLVEERGRLDAVVNVAGISRPTGFAKGSEEDWRAVLSVHLDGYRTVLEAALPHLAAAGRGRILGVTSGSGWRAADAGAYSAAKRAVAALTWQLGRQPPPGVTVNAISPIAVTRMVTAALGRAPAAASPGGGGAAATGGLSLGSMPEPADLGPLAAHLVGDGLAWCSGRVLFAGGSEVAVLDEPRLLEVVRTDGGGPLAPLLEAATTAVLAPAEAAQASGGGGNPRLGPVEGAAATDPTVRTCAVVADDPGLAAAVRAALEARGVRCHVLAGAGTGTFAGAAAALAAAAQELGTVDALVVALAGPAAAGGGARWEQVLAEHADLVEQLHADAAWARAAADHAAATERPLRLVTLTDAATAGGCSRAQAAAQLARAARRATGDRVHAFAVSVEGGPADGPPVAELAALLAAGAAVEGLAGAELVVGRGWLGLRSHPRPGTGFSLGGPDLPPWFDDALRAAVGVDPEEVP
jgi:NAD(P)-dependent dehydrogenase (short-subunit alcohol dehydrogenase family)